MVLENTKAKVSNGWGSEDCINPFRQKASTMLPWSFRFKHNLMRCFPLHYLILNYLVWNTYYHPKG